MNLFSRLYLSFILMLFSTLSFATDTRGYNMLPVGINVIDSQYSIIESTQKSASGLEGKQTQDTLYIRNTYFFNLNGNLAATYVFLPYSKQSLDITKPITLSKTGDGLGDIKVLFALGLYNMPALNIEDFKKFNQNGLHAGCSLTVGFPTGSYDSASKVNSGFNRNSYKPECAAYWINDKFQADLFIGNTIYSDNTSYSGNKTLQQKNLYNIETRFSYNFTPKFWASTDLIYYQGGETSVNNVSQKDEQSNLNAGFTLAYKVAPTQFVKFTYQKTVSGKENSPQMKQGLGITYTLAF